MGLKHLLFVSIVFLLLNILTRITLGGESLSGRLLVEGQWKMLADFAMVIRVTSVSRTWQNKQLHDVLLSHNNHKRNPWKECYTH
jgi:hypothetical protein